MIGYFGDSQVGLQTYWHRQDLQATSETFSGTGGKGAADKDVDPIYLGPGVWYDQQTGYIHCRLAHTRLPEPLVNYRGETDPRKVPLTLAAYRSTPLFFDQAAHVQLQDLVIRGGGYVTVLMEQAHHIKLDNVTIFCGAYGIRSLGSSHLTLHNCGLHGSGAPWTFRSDASKRDYPGRPHRNLSRLNTHSLIEVDAGRESSVWAYPQNDHWKITHCHFTDSHDGVYLGAMHVEFAHNVIENMQDDGIYLSPMYQRHKLDGTDPQILVHHNLFKQVLTALAFGGNEPNTHDQIYVYRNVFDLRLTDHGGTDERNAGGTIADDRQADWRSRFAAVVDAHVRAQHGHRRRQSRRADGQRRRRDTRTAEAGLQQSLFPHRSLARVSIPAAGTNLISDGNLFWSPSTDEKAAAAIFKKWQASPSLAENKKLYEAGSESHSLVADPKLNLNEFQVQPGSAAIDAGVEVKFEGFDPSEKQDADRPDIGAVPANRKMFDVGRLK